MGLFEKCTIVGVAAVLACGVIGCAEKSRAEMRPDPDKVVGGEHGLQSRDLREMTDRMAPDLLASLPPSQFRTMVVVKGVQNKTEDMPGRNMDIYAARLAGLLNQAPTKAQLGFVEEKATVERLQNEELGGTPGVAAPGDTRIKPQYALYGTFYSMDNGRTTYYVCQFQLTSLMTGEKVWNAQYEVRTLN